MPAIGPNSHVLVTGGSGFIAVWCCYQLLERGHSVRATVRSTDKGEHLEQLFKQFGDKFSFVIAEDLEKEGAFDDAVKGVDAVLHTASPFHFNIEGDPRGTLINPALNGTKNVLKSIHQHGDKVQRVVVTSSFASVLDASKEVPYTFTEKDWNESSVANVEKLGNKQEGIDAYRASKTMAERAAWEFVENNKPKWDLTTINPPFVLGPIAHQVNSPEKLNTSAAAVWGLFHGAKKDDDLLKPAGNCVDVRDVAYGHVEALVREEAGGQRFATSLGRYTWQQVADVVHNDSQIPADWKKAVPVGKPGEGDKVVQHTFDGSKATRVLGLNYIPLQKIIEDMTKSFADYEKRGWKGVAGQDILALGKKV
ncbi:NAD(P)-binding protein [Testicularia cyperi]|uniref:NAD(P)-binding protein n=1 Tax=Testicularia cyperi TaxID=1882483 RepID=A0A317XQ40_9BASI|nr:NAD(P)-binding protein [Testicularia cyperi]